MKLNNWIRLRPQRERPAFTGFLVSPLVPDLGHPGVGGGRTEATEGNRCGERVCQNGQKQRMGRKINPESKSLWLHGMLSSLKKKKRFIFYCARSLLLHRGFFGWQWAGGRLLSCCGAQGSGAHGLRSCGAQAQLLRSRWGLPGPGVEPESPALPGGFRSSGPPGKPHAFLSRQANKTKQVLTPRKVGTWVESGPNPGWGQEDRKLKRCQTTLESREMIFRQYF